MESTLPPEPERAFPPGPRPALRLSRDPAAAALELAQALGGKTFAYRWLTAGLEALDGGR
jgi:hypothetical protein